ncbi:MAG: hypothetical protein Q7U54_07810 [Bacteroidales bacterium]|nr:hypothetical protein [Bacteroidales bacterium]
MLKSTSIIILILSLSARLIGQQSYECENKVLTKSLEEKLSGYVLSQPLDNKQYFSRDWFEATITLKEGRIVTGEWLRYNGFLDKFIWLKKSTNQQLILNDEIVEQVQLNSGKVIGNSYFEKIKVKHWYDTDSVFTFLEVLSDGPISLYVQRKVSDSQSSNEFISDYLYFITINNTPLIAVKPRKSSLFASLGKYKVECKQALKKANLSVSNESDLIRAVEYLNSNVDLKK